MTCESGKGREVGPVSLLDGFSCFSRLKIEIRGVYRSSLCRHEDIKHGNGPDLGFWLAGWRWGRKKTQL